MLNFKPNNYGQSAMVVIHFDEQIKQDRFAQTLHHLIDNRIDLSAFYRKYNNEGGAVVPPTIQLSCLK